MPRSLTTSSLHRCILSGSFSLGALRRFTHPIPGTIEWATAGNVELGLFRVDNDGTESDVDFPNSEDEQKNNATIAFAFLALFAAFAGTVLAGIKNAMAHIPFFVAAVCGLIATAICKSREAR